MTTTFDTAGEAGGKTRKATACTSLSAAASGNGGRVDSNATAIEETRINVAEPNRLISMVPDHPNPRKHFRAGAMRAATHASPSWLQQTRRDAIDTLAIERPVMAEPPQ
jgi:hypothetical protein